MKPDTILYPDSFDNHPAAGFDGIFDWSWTKGCFGDTKIMPMDFDGVVERKYNYLIFETKEEGKEIPKGQIITLNNLRNAKSFTIMKIWGKNNPIKIELVYPDGKTLYFDGSAAKNIVKRWYAWADKNQ